MKLIQFVAMTSMLIPAFTPNAANTPNDSATFIASVHGSVFDSLTMQVLSGASVFVPGTTHAGLTDRFGRFDIDGVPIGRQLLAFSSPALDSAGLGTITVAVNVSSDNNAQIKLTTPSFRSIWRKMCRGIKSVGEDSSIVWGTVRDAATNIRQSGAAVHFGWKEMRVERKSMSTANFEFSGDVRTDSTGTFYVCGLTDDIDIAVDAQGKASSSGTVQVRIGNRRLARLDLLVSEDMVLIPGVSLTAEELAAAMKPTGTSTIRGTVRDEKGTPLSNATVFMTAIDTTVETTADGKFTFPGLPAGTHQIGVRKLGVSAVRTIVDLYPDAITEVNLNVVFASELAVIGVRAERASAPDRAGYEERKRTGFGYRLEEADIRNRTDIQSVLQGIAPKLSVLKSKGVLSITTPGISLTSGRPCRAALWIDGRNVATEEVAELKPQDLRAVEVYTRATSAPQTFAVDGCGVVLFWTRSARW